MAALLLFGGTGQVSCNKGSPAFQQPWASLARPHKAAAPFRPRPATTAGRRRARGAGFIALKSSGDASGGSGGFQGRDDQRPCASAGTLRNFLLQRAIQTHVYNLYLVRDQPAYEFIQGFLDHQHFKMITVTDFDFKCAFHGSDGLQTDWETYINSLHSEQTKDITVHFSSTSKAGPDMDQLGKAYEDTFGEMPAWAEASASRKSNPYLDEWKGMPHVEYTEEINPKKIANKLLKVSSQLAEEIKHDLKQVPKANDRLRLLHQQHNVLNQNQSRGPLGKPSDSANETEAIFPVFMADGFVEARSSERTDGSVETTWEPSVLRKGTWDLTLRLLTKVAALEVLDKLAASPEHAALYAWFKGYLG
ncbi:MAG: hypothetical protein ACPIOQ_69195, partial [Promethearchaeia archaeon]